MTNYNWAFYVFILIAFLAFTMLIIIFISALMLKPSGNPEVLKYFSTDFLAAASSYSRTVLLISVSERLLSWIFMSGIIFIFWKNFHANNRIPVLLACSFFALFIIILYIILLPLQYYRGFIIEHRFGLSNQTIGAWFLDFLKARAISLLMNTFILTIIYILIIHMKKNWWIAAAAIFIIFLILTSFVFPVLIDPLFYKFQLLEDKELKEEILKMTDRAGIKVDKILIADASRKTTRTNAYFTGIGTTKRIVIYDNLLNRHPKNEVLAVIAHELGHWKYRHIFISLMIGSAAIILVLFILRLFQSGLNLNSSIKTVLILFILFSIISYIAIPFQNFISRSFEKQSDYAALQLTKDPQTQINMFKKLAVSNLSNVDPHPVLRFIIFSHPPIMERINNVFDNL
ncbi:MAG: M48 family metallopeptidase [Actinobacteria bacterium]|nr:M48 family metallopeptidase [Actinomycetota bacterium]MBM3713102.1 M48 family metallopeptidase [Actinomycetota bacterium]